MIYHYSFVGNPLDVTEIDSLLIGDIILGCQFSSNLTAGKDMLHNVYPSKTNLKWFA